jgi:cytochrome c553
MEMATFAKLIVTSTAAAFLVLAASWAVIVTAPTAKATAQYAKQTGKACGYCHVNPGGGGKLKSAGQKFQKNGHKL